MKEHKTEESSECGIEDDDVFKRRLGISRARLREIDTCPFIDELTRLNHAPFAVLEAEYLAEVARRNHDPVAALEAHRMVESAWLSHERSRAEHVTRPDGVRETD
jgi:hypothetical protein